VLAELTRIEAGWPLAASLAVALTTQGLLAGRRRMALNEALHELRRPLQGLVLTVGAGDPRDAGLSEQTTLALARLDREINGGAAVERRQEIEVAALLERAVRRWQGRAALAGRTLRLRDHCSAVTLSGDQGALAQALDNLIANAIEHGGSRVLIGAELEPPVARLLVADSGRSSPRARRTPVLSRLIASLPGRRRRGHGLRVVRRVAATHGGEFRLRRCETGTEATLELPLAGGGGSG
jgi:signal transduction histidine kinase